MPNRVKDKIDRTDYYTTLAQVESSGDPNAEAESSSASGLYQFIESTWKGLVEEMGVNYTLDDRFDPEKSRKVVEYFTNQNARYLRQKLGREPNEAELYIAHFGGMGTAGKLADLSADSDIREMFSDSAIKANKAVFEKNKIENVKQFYDWAASKFNVPQEQRLYRDTESKPTIKTASPQISEFPQSQQTIDNTAIPRISENLINLQKPNEITNFVLPFTVYEDDEEEEKDPDSKEVSQAKQILNKRKATRDFLTQLVQQNLDYQPVEYVRTNPYQQQMQNGGKVRIIDKDGQEKEVDINSKEYRDHYKSGDLVIQTGEDEYLTSLPAVEISSRDKRYPYYHTLSDIEKKYFNDESPIGRAIRGKATSGRTFNADDALAIPGQLLSGVGEVLQAPQSAMVEGIEALRGNEYDFERILPSLTDSDKQQRMPSEAWGYENPEGFWQNAANLSMDIVADPTLVTGAGAIGRNVVKKGVKSAGKKATKNIDDFKSEIDWAKWNKEIPQNTQLMKEYNAIEQQTKANGTWMKNPDGSAFKGTPEQFIQQNSENFKKAFPNPVLDDMGNVQINYHGSPYKFEEFKPALKPTDKTGERLGSGIYTTPKKTKALEYAIKNQNKKGNLYELYQNANNKQTAIQDIDNYITTKIEKIKSDFLNKKISNQKANELYDAVLKENDELWDKIPDSEFKLQKGKDYLRIDDEQIVPFNNYPKSAIGNNGMFDMTNPNIYKALIPAVATGAATQLSGEDENELKNGGNLTKYKQ